MKTLLEKLFKEKQYTFEMWHTVHNTGIGYYEYWGAVCYDKGEEYIEGIVNLVFKGSFSKEEVKDFSYEYNDEIVDKLLERAEVYQEVEIIESLGFIKEDNSLSFYIRFTAN